MRFDIKLRNEKILKLYRKGIARKEVAFKLKIAYETVRKAIWILERMKENMRNENKNRYR